MTLTGLQILSVPVICSKCIHVTMTAVQHKVRAQVAYLYMAALLDNLARRLRDLEQDETLTAGARSRLEVNQYRGVLE